METWYCSIPLPKFFLLSWWGFQWEMQIICRLMRAYDDRILPLNKTHPSFALMPMGSLWFPRLYLRSRWNSGISVPTIKYTLLLAVVNGRSWMCGRFYIIRLNDLWRIDSVGHWFPRNSSVVATFLSMIVGSAQESKRAFTVTVELLFEILTAITCKMAFLILFLTVFIMASEGDWLSVDVSWSWSKRVWCLLLHSLHLTVDSQSLNWWPFDKQFQQNLCFSTVSFQSFMFSFLNSSHFIERWSSLQIQHL